MITITDQAARKVTQTLAKRGHGEGLRIGVKTTGCSGLAYVLEYVDTPNADDQCYDCNGCKLFVDPKSMVYVEGLEVDYVRQGLNEGLSFGIQMSVIVAGVENHSGFDIKWTFCYNTRMAKCYILVGVPGSGKSTWIKSQNFDWSRTVVASTDDYVDRAAALVGMTYSEVFKEVMPDAVKYMALVVTDAVKKGHDIVWDQTSTTVPSRAKKFRMLPSNYEVIAVVFRTPDEAELTRRLASRPGKEIPKYVMESMRANWQEPSMAEGFASIIHVG